MMNPQDQAVNMCNSPETVLCSICGTAWPMIVPFTPPLPSASAERSNLI